MCVLGLGLDTASLTPGDDTEDCDPGDADLGDFGGDFGGFWARGIMMATVDTNISYIHNF